MKVLVTGADGLLGNNLVRELLEREYQVSVLLLDRKKKSTALEALPLTFHYGNILDVTELENAVRGNDMVIHAAASTQVFPPRDHMIHEINVRGTANVIEACLKHGIKRLIHIGTANSFQPGSIENPGTEDGPYTGAQYGLDYIDSKYEAQKKVLDAVKTRGLNAVVLNPTFMIGPYDSKPSSGAMVMALYKKKIPAYTHGSKSYIAVKDAAVAISNALTMGRTGECYLLSNFNLTHREAFTIMGKAIDVKPPKIGLPSFLIRLIGSIGSLLAKLRQHAPAITKEIAVLSCGHHCYSGEKARRELKMPCTDLGEATKGCLDWLKANGYTK
jgi:dihydroflavonol-4-reductase